MAAAFFVVSLFGFIEASYLTIKHYQGEVPPCVLFEGCDVVTTSRYSAISGIPVAVLGAIYYLGIVLLCVAFFDTKKEKILRLISYATPLGFIASAWFVYLQFVVLKATCVYCMGSAISSTLLFILGMVYLRKSKSLS